MEAGERWTLNDVAGKPVYAWDSRDHIFRTTYDALRRPMESFLRVDDSAEIIIGRTEYGESRQNPEIDNVRGRATQIFDQAGVVISDQYDFKGNLLRHRRQLSPVYDATLDWAGNVPLEPEEYTIRTRYDALNRVVQQVAFYGGEARGRVNVVQHRYNDANLVDQIDSWISIGAEPDGLLDASTATLHAITKIDYDAKGMRTQITYGNATVSVYRYDPLTLRLASLVTRRDPSAFAADSQPSPAPGWPGSCLQNLTYTYDPAGNVTTVRDDAQQTIFFRNTRVEPSNNYAYDATYQLIEATGREHLGQVGGVPVPHSHDDAPRVGLLHPGDGNAMGRYLERYVYDAVGNMLSTRHLGSDPAHAGWTRSYTYAERSQLEPTKVSNRLTMTALGQANEVYSTGDGYDAHGNMLFLPQLGTAGAASNLKWDHRNQLRDADLGAIGFLHCSYDDTGQRVRKILRKANGVIEQRAYFGDFELFLRENSGSDRLERETLHITDGAKRIVIIEWTRPEATKLRLRSFGTNCAIMSGHQYWS
jgi:hypothetical protein